MNESFLIIYCLYLPFRLFRYLLFDMPTLQTNKIFERLFAVVFASAGDKKIWIFYRRISFTRLLPQLENALNFQDLVDSFGIFGGIGILWLMWILVKWSNIITLAMDDNIWTQSWLQCPFWTIQSYIFMNFGTANHVYWGKLSISKPQHKLSITKLYFIASMNCWG